MCCGSRDNPGCETFCGYAEFPAPYRKVCEPIPRPPVCIKWILQSVTIVLCLILAIVTLVDLAGGLPEAADPRFMEAPLVCSGVAPPNATVTSDNSDMNTSSTPPEDTSGNPTYVEGFTPQLCLTDEQILKGECPFRIQLLNVQAATVDATAKNVTLVVRFLDTIAFMLVVLGYCALCSSSRKINKYCRSKGKRLTEKQILRKKKCRASLNGTSLIFDPLVLPVIIVCMIIAAVSSSSVSVNDYYLTHKLAYGKSVKPVEESEYSLLDVDNCTKGMIGDESANITLYLADNTNITGATLTPYQFEWYNHTKSKTFAAEWEEELSKNIFPGLLFLFLSTLALCLDSCLHYQEQTEENDQDSDADVEMKG